MAGLLRGLLHSRAPRARAADSLSRRGILLRPARSNRRLRRRLHAVRGHSCMCRQNGSTAQQRTTIKQPAQPVRTAHNRLNFRRHCAHLDRVRTRDAWSNAQLVVFNIFIQHSSKICRHSSGASQCSITAQPARGRLARHVCQWMPRRVRYGRAQERKPLACLLVPCLGVHVLSTCCLCCAFVLRLCCAFVMRHAISVPRSEP